MSLQFSDVKFYQAFVNQSLLKLVHFSPSYSKHKRGGGLDIVYPSTFGELLVNANKVLTEQFADRRTCSQSSHRLINLLTADFKKSRKYYTIYARTVTLLNTDIVQIVYFTRNHT